MIILGIDPGLAITGYGIIKVEDDVYNVLNLGIIKTAKVLRFSERLSVIYKEISSIIEENKPDEIAIEELFFSKNTKTAMIVSQARGVLILACIHQNIQIFEYTPLQVKQGVTGYGKANKAQVTKMVSHLLRLENPPKPDDAADALAIAICHGNHKQHSWMTHALSHVI